MINLSFNKLKAFACLPCALLVMFQAHAADFNVTSPGFFYTINAATPNPDLTLVRGKTYTFLINASSIHPFFISSPGVVNNNISQGTITYTVPTNAQNYTYFCSIHGFGANIITVAPTNTPPPPPPVIQISSITINSNVVLTSTGTNTWTLFPEYKTNLTETNWFALTIQTNTFFNGTNETVCGKPVGDAVFIRIRAQSN